MMMSGRAPRGSRRCPRPGPSASPARDPSGARIPSPSRRTERVDEVDLAVGQHVPRDPRALEVPDSVSATWTETIASAPSSEGRLVDAALKSPGDDAAVVGNGRIRRGHPRPEVAAVQVDAGPERLVAEVDDQRDDMDTGFRRLGRVEIGRRVGEDRDASHVGTPPPDGPCAGNGRLPGIIGPRPAVPVRCPGMDRSMWAVLAGTFTLRFSTGLTGAMLAVYLAQLPQHGGEVVTATTLAVLHATFYLAELVLSPFFGILSDRLGHHRVMLYGPGLRGDRRDPDRADDQSHRPRRDALARGRVDRRQRPVDPRVHRDRDGGRRAAPRQGVRPLRGRDPARARRRVRRRADRLSPRSGRPRSSSTRRSTASRS